MAQFKTSIPLVLAMLLLAACGGTANSSSSSSSNSSSSNSSSSNSSSSNNSSSSGRSSSSSSSSTSSSGAQTPNCASVTADPDGDGWGQENGMLCKIIPVINPVTGFPDCRGANPDPDGDGWGLESEMMCKVIPKPSTSTLFQIGQNVKIMPLGDSITGSPGCWRSYLWNGLASAGVKNLNFVGTLSAPYCTQDHDADNEGHGGYLVTNIAAQNQLPPWLNTTNPDLVLMHLGTNDVWNNKSTNDILNAYTKLVEQMRTKNPRMVIVVAQIIPMTPRGSSICTGCFNGVKALNEAIPAWANKLSTSNSPILVADLWVGFDVQNDTSDGVHPVDSGNRKMAAAWQKILLPLFPH